MFLDSASGKVAQALRALIELDGCHHEKRHWVGEELDVEAIMTYETILYEVADRIATITFIRPQRQNAINEQTAKELTRRGTVRAQGRRSADPRSSPPPERPSVPGADVERDPRRRKGSP